MNAKEKQAQLFCTPPHIVKALLRRESFPGTIWEPSCGRGDLVKVLQKCGYQDVLPSDLNDWGFPCEQEDFLTSSTESDSLVTNPPFDLKWKFLDTAKRLVRQKIALLLPIMSEYTVGFTKTHDDDPAFPWKAKYSFLQSVEWKNTGNLGGKLQMAWYVFERGYCGEVVREKIRFKRRPNQR